MEYTNEMFEEDRKLALFTFGRYYKKFARYKDDLVQVALIKAPRARELYSEDKGKYSTYAVLHFRSAMVKFLIKELRHNHLGDDLSLDLCFRDSEFNLYETLGYEEDKLQEINFEQLKDFVTKIILKPRKRDPFTLAQPKIALTRRKNKEMTADQKNAFEYFINGKSIPYIADERGVSSQAVSCSVSKYRMIIQQELKEQGFVEWS